MTIVCGTDTSEAAMRAEHAAAAIAHRLGEPLRLVHVIGIGAELGEPAFAGAGARLQARADDLRARFEIDAEAIAVSGRVDTEVIAIAERTAATIVVIAAVGQPRRHRWLLGSTAERIVRHSPIPVLVVRDDAPLTGWTRGQRALEIVVGVEHTSGSKLALEWAAGLRRIGPCDLQIVHLASASEAHRRLGLDAHESPLAVERLRPEAEELLVHDLRTWIGTLPGPGETLVEVHDHLGRADRQLCEMAESADLIVVGTHRRAGIDRLWHGSVSRGVLEHASTSVACVPLTGSLERSTEPTHPTRTRPRRPRDPRQSGQRTP